GVPGGQRVEEGVRVGDPVGVTARNRSEAGIEGGIDLGGGVDDHVVSAQVAQRPAQPGGQRIPGGAGGAADEPGPHGIGAVQVDDLPAGMHPGIGAPGDDGAHRGAADRLQSRLDEALHGAGLGLAGPAVEVGAPVAEVEADPPARPLRLTHRPSLSRPGR
ncbi:hypothetical protein CJ671_10810, partial [Aliarcobacter cryaerophilus]